VGGTHAGLIRFVLVDKEMDRFYLEQSLYTVPSFLFSLPPREKRKDFSTLLRCTINIFHIHIGNVVTSDIICGKLDGTIPFPVLLHSCIVQNKQSIQYVNL
jgi:hypothetical protein